MNFFFECCGQKQYMKEDTDSVLDNLDILGHPKRILRSSSKQVAQKPQKKLIMEIIDPSNPKSKGIKSLGNVFSPISIEEEEKDWEDNSPPGAIRSEKGSSTGNETKKLENPQSSPNGKSSHASTSENPPFETRRMEMKKASMPSEIPEQPELRSNSNKLKSRSQLSLGQQENRGGMESSSNNQKKGSSDYFLPDFGGNKQSKGESSMVYEPQNQSMKMKKSETAKEESRSQKAI